MTYHLKFRCRPLFNFQGTSQLRVAVLADSIVFLEPLKDGDNAFPGHGNARDKEMMLLKRKLAKVEQEWDFLKGTAAYLAKESQ